MGFRHSLPGTSLGGDRPFPFPFPFPTPAGSDQLPGTSLGTSLGQELLQGADSQAQGFALGWYVTPLRGSGIGASPDCTTGYLHQIGRDEGRHVIHAGEIHEPEETPGQDCDMGIVVERTRTGTVDPAYGEGGVITARQHRRVSVRSVP